MGREGSQGVSPQTQKPNSAYGNGQTILHYNPIKNTPKCTIFIFKIQKFFSGEGCPPPRTPHPSAPSAPRFSRLRCSMGPPRKNIGYGPGREGKGEVGQGTGDEGGEGRALSSFGIGPSDAESAKNLRIKVSKVSK
jgi:hypothetical protein